MNTKENQSFQKLQGDPFSTYINGPRHLGISDLFEMMSMRSGIDISTAGYKWSAGRRHGFAPDLSFLKQICFAGAPVVTVEHDLFSEGRRSRYVYLYRENVAVENLIGICFSYVEEVYSGVTITAVRDYVAEAVPFLAILRPLIGYKLHTLTLTSEGVRSITTEMSPHPKRIAYPEFYPYLEGQYLEIFDRFIESSAGSIMFIGPAGTGKSTLARTWLARGGRETMTTSDLALMRSPDLLTHFFQSSASFLLMEDGDNALGHRKEGNAVMSTYLNMFDGVTEPEEGQLKKTIVSTNLASLDSVDDAFYRDGRCFGVIQFRKLTIPEAHLAREAAGLPSRNYGNETEVTLATALTDPNRLLIQAKAPKIFGFSRRD